MDSLRFKISLSNLWATKHLFTVSLQGEHYT